MLAESSASSSVLGLDFETLGVGVAKAWGLPETLQHSMRRPRGEPLLRPPVQPAERLRWIIESAGRLGYGSVAATDR